MRRLVLSLAFATLFSASSFSQTTQTLETAPPPAPKDPQAVSILNKAINVAGGAAAIGAITDYSATGNIMFHQAQDVEGSVTIKSLHHDYYRQDATLPNGIRTEIVSQGRSTFKTEAGLAWQRYLHSPWNPSALALPYSQLVYALKGSTVSVTYKGTASINGSSAYDISLQLLPAIGPKGAMADSFTRDFFIDASTFQLVMTQEPDFRPGGWGRQIRYSNFQVVNGMLVAFTFSGGPSPEQPAWTITLNQIDFNSGLDASVFTVSGVGKN